MEQLEFLDESERPFNFRYINVVFSENGQEQFLVHRIVNSSVYNTENLISVPHHKPISKFLDFENIDFIKTKKDKH